MSVKKLLNCLLCFCLTLCLVQAVSANALAASPKTGRLEGIDRYKTAVAISKAGWESAENVVLATGENYPDALCAAPLARQLDAPILLTEKSQLNTDTEQEITRLGAKKVFIIGGAGVISDSVRSALEAKDIKVERLWGNDRYDTAIKVAEYMKNNFEVSSELAVVTGEAYADALSISPIAALKGIIIILVPKDNMTNGIESFIAQNRFTKTYVIGGSDVIGDEVASRFPGYERIEGTDKYDRNIAVLNKFAGDLKFDTVYIATGEKYPDALAGSGLAPKTSSPIILCPPVPPRVTWGFVNEKIPLIKELKALGGASVVSGATLENMLSTQYSETLAVRTYNSNGDLILNIDYEINETDTNYRNNPMLNYDYMVDQKDTDGDGLTDYEEIHKYLTDPNNPDSDSDGIPDGDADERREYTYTIKAVREVDIRYNPDSIRDTFQDAKIISDTGKKLKYEVVLYPYAEDIVEGDPNWRKNQKNSKFEGLLKPRKTTNWDIKMQQELLKAIPENCKTDLDVVRFFVPYFGERVNADPTKGDQPVDLWVDLRTDKTIITKHNVEGFLNNRIDKNQSDEDYIRQMLFGKTMYYGKILGACTASATYMTTILRAVGIPARMIHTSSLLDNFDETQRSMINNLKNEEIKKQLLKEGKTFADHHYLEAYVDGRWIKINNNCTIFESNYLGDSWAAFCIKTDTYFDFADTPASDIWLKGFPDPMPYKLISLSDQYGKCYDEARQPYFKKKFKFGLDTSKFESIYLYGDREFDSFMKAQLEGVNITRKSSYGYNYPEGSAPFEKEWMENSLMIISGRTDYDILYDGIKSQISSREYKGLGKGEYKTLKVKNATVVIVN